jgi:hypothetical protein
MISGLNNSSNIVQRALLLGLWAMVFLSLWASLCWGKSIKSDGSFFSSGTKDKTLQKVLDQLGQEAGYSIEISANSGNIDIMVPTKGMQFEEGLKAVIKSAGIKNYAVIRNETQKKLRIYVVGALTLFGNQTPLEKGTYEDGDQFDGGTFYQDETPAALLEDMLAKSLIGVMPLPDKERVPPPPEEMFKGGGDQGGSVGHDDKAIPSPSEELINQHHGTAATSNTGPVALPPEEVIRQHNGKGSLSGESANIPPPPIEMLKPR